MSKVLITGGAGCIGQATAQHFKNKGFEVVTYDIVTPDQIIDKHVCGTIMYVDELYQAMVGCDYVIHLAAMLGVARTESNQMECLNININGTKNVLDACVYAGVKKVIFGSSSEVYGEPETNPITEKNTVSPKSVYAVSKLAGEEYTRAYKQQYNLDYVILRFFNAYGPGQVAEFVIPRFVQAVLNNESPKIYGEGNQERCFCYVSDTAQGIYLAAINNVANGEIFNIGNDQTTISMKDLAKKVITLAGKNIEPEFISMEKSDRLPSREIVKRYASIDKAQEILGYKPIISLDDGIKNVMQSNSLKSNWQSQKNQYNKA